MIVIEREDRIAVDALVVDVAEALLVDVGPDVADAPIAPVAPVAPVVTARGGALAQPLPEPIELEIAQPGDVEGEDEAARPHLRVAPDGYRRRRRVRIAAAAAAIAISITLFAVVVFNVVLAQHQIELQSLQQKLQAEQSRYYALRESVAQRSSPENIVAKAKGLGLSVQQPSYLSVPIKPPPAGPTGTDQTLNNATQNTKGALDNPTP